jgi:hypothetical protein
MFPFSNDKIFNGLIRTIVWILPHTFLLLSGHVVARAETSADAAKEALAKQEGDEDTTKLLQETLTATDKRYSLLGARNFALNYDFFYSYIGEQLIEADFDAQDLTNFSIENTQGHTLINTISLDYGIMNNLTGNITVPLVSKYSDTDEIDGDAHAFGDVSLGVRFQPFPISHEWPSLTLNATYLIPTGRSPYEASQRELATGSGYGAVNIGLNTSKVIDPVAIFGSLSFTYNMEEDGLEFVQDDVVITTVTPGTGIGWGVGFAYALSYGITTTMSFQQFLQGSTDLEVINQSGEKDKIKTGNQTSAVINFGLGVRLESTTLNFSVGVGLTPDSPDFTLRVNVPLRF